MARQSKDVYRGGRSPASARQCGAAAYVHGLPVADDGGWLPVDHDLKAHVREQLETARVLEFDCKIFERLTHDLAHD